MPFVANYHTHTFRCEHATGDCVEYAREAVAAGIVTLGFSDHTPLPDNKWSDMRMSMAQMEDYEAAVKDARVAQPSLNILLGLECEYRTDLHSWYQDEILGQRGYHYLIAGCHFTPLGTRWISSFGQLQNVELLRAYAAYTIQTMESGLFDFVTHPDIVGTSWDDWNDDLSACANDICAAAASLQMPLEINSYGYRKPWVACRSGQRPAYPWEPFWAIAARHAVKVVLSSDAHQPSDVAAGYDEVAAIRDQFGLLEADLSYIGRS
jgi:histidinol-phosphatase (PHP family)